MTDHDDLVAKYSIPVEDLNPDERRAREAEIDLLDRLAKEGKFASPEQLALQDTPIGVNDRFEAFPVTSTDATQDEGPSHD